MNIFPVIGSHTGYTIFVCVVGFVTSGRFYSASVACAYLVGLVGVI